MKTQSISMRQTLLKSLLSLSCMMLLGLFSNSVTAQSTERTVTGVVQCSQGPLPYAAIVLKGTSIGVSSDSQGKFTFPQLLKENDVLLVSYLGFKDAEITITADTNFIQPYLEDIPVVIVASLRTKATAAEQVSTKTNGSFE